MIRILLVQPRPHPEAIILGIMEPLALEVLATVLDHDAQLAGEVQVQILDMRLEKDSSLRRILEQWRPHLVALTGITIDYPDMITIIQQVKAYDRMIVTIVGGHHATMVPTDFYLPPVDLIVRGPGEKVLPQIIKAFATDGDYSNIAGVTYQQEGHFYDNGTWDVHLDMQAFPIPDRRFIARYRRKYWLDGAPTALLITSRGCPFRCTFCACWKIMQGRYLTRAPASVVEELARLPQKYIFIGDDNTFGDIARADQIADLIHQQGIRKKIQAYARADTIVKYPQTFAKWARIGLCGLTVGFEFIREEDLAACNKQIDLATNEEANRILARYGIDNYIQLMVKPSFSEEDFQQLGRYAYQCGVVHPSFPVLTPLPGTELRNQETELYPDEHQYHDLVHPLLPTKLGPEVFYQQLVQLFCRNYSYRRWLKARAKKLLNFLPFGPQYPWHETRAPEWYSIPLARWWLKRAVNPRKLAPFFRKFQTL